MYLPKRWWFCKHIALIYSNMYPKSLSFLSEILIESIWNSLSPLITHSIFSPHIDIRKWVLQYFSNFHRPSNADDTDATYVDGGWWGGYLATPPLTCFTPTCQAVKLENPQNPVSLSSLGNWRNGMGNTGIRNVG